MSQAAPHPAAIIQTDWFALFDLPTQFDLDEVQLDSHYYALQSSMHPDKNALLGGPAQRQFLQAASHINDAHQGLRDPAKRAAYLLSLRGHPEDPRDTRMPADFLLHQITWREALADARGARDVDGLEALEQEVADARTQLLGQLANLLDRQYDAEAAMAALRKLRFLDRLLDEIDFTLSPLVD